MLIVSTFAIHTNQLTSQKLQKSLHLYKTHIETTIRRNYFLTTLLLIRVEFKIKPVDFE